MAVKLGLFVHGRRIAELQARTDRLEAMLTVVFRTMAEVHEEIGLPAPKGLETFQTFEQEPPERHLRAVR